MRCFICVAGIDGSGKSTVSERLIMANKGSLKYVWARWEPFFLNPFIELVNKKLKKSNIGKHDESVYEERMNIKKQLLKYSFIKKIWLLLAEIDYFFQLLCKVSIPYLFKKKIICDRYIYDFYIDQCINLEIPVSNFESIFKTRLLKIFPKPDLLFYIKISPKIGYARKNDGTSQSYLEERVKYYDKLKSIYRTIEIDGEQKLDDVVYSVMHEAGKFLKR